MYVTSELTIDLWTDLICPFCYIGEARLRRALDAEGLSASIRIRSFELDPGITEPVSGLERFTAQKGMPRAQVEQMEGQLKSMAEAEGLAYANDRLIGSTIPVHILTQLATRQGNGYEFFRAVQSAYFSGSLNPFSSYDLLDFAAGHGLDRSVAEAALSDEELLTAVRDDQQIAQQLNVTGVPYALVERRLAIPGAVSVEQFQDALRQASAL